MLAEIIEPSSLESEATPDWLADISDELAYQYEVSRFSGNVAVETIIEPVSPKLTGRQQPYFVR